MTQVWTTSFLAYPNETTEAVSWNELWDSSLSILREKVRYARMSRVALAPLYSDHFLTLRSRDV
jgi:hypothetical protein